MKKFSFLSALCGAAMGIGAVASANAATTLEAVKAKGFVQCGVSQGLPGFSNADDSGKWTGLDVDLCRAVAAAVFMGESLSCFIANGSLLENFIFLNSLVQKGYSLPYNYSFGLGGMIFCLTLLIR